MSIKLTNNAKRWLISTGVTFGAAFLMVVYNQIDNLTLETIKGGALVGLLFSSVRAGVKALIESFLFWHKNNGSDNN